MICPAPFLRRLAVVAMLASNCLIASGAENPKRTFNVPANAAQAALREFSRQAGVQLIFDVDKVAGVRTASLQGEHTPRAALDRMLAGTPLVAVQDEQTGALTVRRSSGPNAPRGASATGDHPVSAVPAESGPAARALAAMGQANRGTVSGRIYKPRTGEYVRSAIVRIEGADRSVESQEGGYYRFADVPAGEVQLVITYTGYTTVTAAVTVIAGQAAVRDFELRMPGERAPAGEAGAVPLKLVEFIVSSEREGNSKAIQAQKNSMNITSHVASDVFGDVPEGNVGEFLKFLPGVELDYVSADARGVRLRGMDPQYVNVTMDGVKLASADAFGATVGTENNGTEGSRAFGFESVSLSSVDAVEVFKTLTSDMDANAPAGTINLRSKRAFDRNGRRILLQANLTGNSEELNFKDSPGPGDANHRKIRPGGTVEISDVFFNKRLGLVLNLTASDVYNEQYTFRAGFSRATTPTDSRSAVPVSLNYVDSPKITKRLTGTFTVDYRASTRLNFGVTTSITRYEATTNEQSVNLVLAANNTGATGRSTVLGDNPLLRFETSPHAGANMSLGGTGFFKLTNSVTVTPRIEYRPTDKLFLEGKFGYSYSNNDYEGVTRGQARQAITNSITGASGLVFRGERASIDSSHWKITQVAGPDWSDLANHTRPRVNDEGRLDINEVMTGHLDATFRPGWKWLTFLKAGIKSSEEHREFHDERPWNQYEYIGPGGIVGTTLNTGSWAAYPATTPFDLGSDMHATLRSISGRIPQFPGKSRLARLMRDNPGFFTRGSFETAANYYAAFIGNTRDLTERVDAAYLTGGTRFRKLQVQAGFRWEETSTSSITFDPRSRDEVSAAGFAVRTVNPVTSAVTYTLPGTTNAAFDGTSRHVQIPGLQYQFETLPKKRTQGNYDNLFPSLVAKYSITPNLIAQAGFNKAISRPNLISLAGPITVNESNLSISVPNAGLLPEQSRNLSGRLAYYFEPVGTVSVGLFQNTISDIRNNFQFSDPEDFAQFGLDPDEYPGYVINSTRNGAGTRRFRGMEVEYRQSLSFLPGALRGLGIFANYTRNYADQRRGGLVPHQISGGASYSWRRLSTNARVVWTPDTPWTQNNINQYREGRTLLDLSASYKITDRVSVSVSGRNVGNEPHRRIERRPEGRIVANEEYYGAAWSMTVRGTF